LIEEIQNLRRSTLQSGPLERWASPSVPESPLLPASASEVEPKSWRSVSPKPMINAATQMKLTAFG